MKNILNRYLLEEIYVNVFSPGDGELCTLFDIKDNYFSVRFDNGFKAYYPYSSIISIYEKNNDLIIEIKHQIESKDYVKLADTGYSF